MLESLLSNLLTHGTRLAAFVATILAFSYAEPAAELPDWTPHLAALLFPFVAHAASRAGVRAIEGARDGEAFLRRFLFFSLLLHLFLLSGYASLLYVTGLGEGLADRPLLGIPVLRESILLIPYGMALLLAALPYRRLDARFRGRLLSRGRYLGLKIREVLLPILAFFLVYGLHAAIIGVPSVAWVFAYYPALETFFIAVFVLFLFLVAPLAIRFFLPVRSLPPGPMRTRLEAMLRRAEVGCRDIKEWQTRGIPLATAFIAGIFSGTRFVVFTDFLLRRLEPEEAAAVMAHETAHVRRGHLSLYLGCALSFVLLLSPLEAVSEAAGLDDVWTLVLFFALFGVVALLWWWGGFGYLSRRLELEADWVGVQLCGSLTRYLSVLQRIGVHHDTSRGTWRHFSLRDRAQRLARLEADRSRRRRFERELRRLKALVWTACFLGIAAWAATLGTELAHPDHRQAGFRALAAEQTEVAREAFRAAVDRGRAPLDLYWLALLEAETDAEHGIELLEEAREATDDRELKTRIDRALREIEAETD